MMMASVSLAAGCDARGWTAGTIIPADRRSGQGQWNIPAYDQKDAGQTVSL